MTAFRNIGLMSGTSMDGLDIVYCELTKSGSSWKYKILHADTIIYNKEWKTRLNTLHEKSSRFLLEAHADYGRYLGEITRDFLHRHQREADLICSHGHTIYHQPDKGITFQLGSGQAIANVCLTKVVSDFRSKDVLYGGQGAPLVPAGDELLFPDYASCLNLGGFSNISFRENNRRIAFDICPVNMALNHISRQLGYEYDRDGNMAASGKTDHELLHSLNELSYYQTTGPKSLGREWFEKYFLPLLEASGINPEDKLRTTTEHIAYQIAKVINKTTGNCLVTGGGAFNTFLIQRLIELSGNEIVIPSAELVSYKESLVFALLGALRFRNEINCLSSVTGASKDTSAGTLYIP